MANRKAEKHPTSLISTTDTRDEQWRHIRYPIASLENRDVKVCRPEGRLAGVRDSGATQAVVGCGWTLCWNMAEWFSLQQIYCSPACCPFYLSEPGKIKVSEIRSTGCEFSAVYIYVWLLLRNIHQYRRYLSIGYKSGRGKAYPEWSRKIIIHKKYKPPIVLWINELRGSYREN